MTACMTDPISAGIAQISTQNEQARTQLRAQGEAFWTLQDQILGQMEQLSHAWFERRHAGTHAALQASINICSGATPADALQAYMAWAGGSLERLTRDVLDAQGWAASMADLFLGATHNVLHGASEAGRADLMTPTEADATATLKQAA